MSVPKLRFPEFLDAGEWEEKKLEDIATIKAGTTPSRANSEFYANGSIPWVKTTDLNNSYIYTTQEKVTPLAKVKLNPIGSVLVAMYGGFNQIGRTGYLKIPAATNQAISVLNVKKDILTSAYLLIWLNAKIDYWKKLAISSRKDANITGSDVADFPIAFPSLIEQQKIADCLSFLSDRITAETQKLNTLKAHKKGLMQQLFPAEGETLPKLRFPEFQDAGEWEVKELSQVCQVNPSVNNLPETFVYIDLESVDSGNLHQKKVISREGAPSRAQRLLKRHDVIFQMVRPYQRNNYYFDANDDISYVASTGYAQLRAHDSSLYLFQYLHNDNFVDRVLAKCTGSNYPAINSSDLSKILVEIPTLSEQQKIADCLTSIDEAIAAQSEAIDLLKLHKKGLMQQLFPSVEEVRG
ncbi:MAG: restriction endonuclease subunit S [Pseudanabaena sp. Salubria-1]|jgi:restriction endonuclease S subunit|nr:restriction endonuclease subunit S [Pseudanabaena sp. Salubria-1]